MKNKCKPIIKIILKTGNLQKKFIKNLQTKNMLFTSFKYNLNIFTPLCFKYANIVFA